MNESSSYEIWAEYFRVKNELMDLWDGYIQAISNIRILERMGKHDKRIAVHRITAEKCLMLLYYKGVPAGALTSDSTIQECIDNPDVVNLDKYFLIAKTIMKDFENRGLYNVTKEKGDPSKSITYDKSY